MTSNNGDFICASEAMKKIRDMIAQVADTDVTILIHGESGVGKEVVARSIYKHSNRRDKPFVKVHCAAMPSELLESELFGFERGAFTGAYHQKAGKFELGDGGSIFLDEIGEMSPAHQAKLLQVLQDGEFSRIGGRKDIRVDVRVLAATNQKLEDAIKMGRFREDLYYRLNAVNIFIPPLRERREEIPLFVEHFLTKYETKYQKIAPPFSQSLMEVFMRHEWTGNVREMENLIQRYVLLQNENDLWEEMMEMGKVVEGRAKTDPNPNSEKSLADVVRSCLYQSEAKMIYETLQQNRWNRKKVSELLQVSYGGLCKKIKKYGLETFSETCQN